MTDIQLVDDQDQILRGGSMDEAQLNGIWHRIVRVVVRDNEENILLQKVPENSFYYQNCWNTSVSGHVDVDEGYEEAALREAEEEIGLRSRQLEEVDYYSSHRVDGGRTYNRFNKTYHVVADSTTSLTANKEELAGIEWFSVQQVIDLVRSQPDKVTDGLAEYVEHVLLKNQEGGKS